eukprot:CAMPEP_0185024226 /NCGR_PEP_ID=MMETSP1103-20130426/7220_1 /TAXON_ID=36769 /ORGANISM="Paraphysomonas bandaiensis, Strain Caron Lab Isolate" /LENGTH=224 /DNA_ID=CAMNT_0027557145 /DNA_START=60 /DNA_END=734 /DNA_ORIENTATION=+
MADPAQPAPKMDMKMLVLPVMFFLQKQIDMKSPEVIQYARIGIVTAAVVGLATYFFIWQMVSSNKNTKKIWVPPKPQPSIPFLTPPPEAPKPEEYSETTYPEHEKKLVMEALQGLAMSCGIALFMSFKFDIHLSCMMQAVMVPIGLWENVLVQKYVLGNKTENAYNELDSAPESGSPGAESNANDDDDDNFPRVEELPSDDDDTVKVEKADAEPVAETNSNCID